MDIDYISALEDVILNAGWAFLGTCNCLGEVVRLVLDQLPFLDWIDLGIHWNLVDDVYRKYEYEQ